MERRHLYYNDDGNTAMVLDGGPVERSLFTKHVNALEGAPITTYVLCVSDGDTTCFPAQYASPYWWRDTPAGRQHKSYVRTMEIFRRIGEEGWDYPCMVMARALALGFRFIPSMRMNDAHYAQKIRPEDNPFTGKFRLEHPEMVIRPESPYPEHRRSITPHWFVDHILSFAHDEVRALRLAHAFEIIDRYAHDGFEMDWTRHYGYFRDDDVRPGLITDMVRKVRAKLREREKATGRKMTFIVRVAPSIADSLALGFDVATWVREELVDVVVPASWTRTATFDMPMGEWAKLVAGTGIEVHASPDTMTVRGNVSLDMFRAIASNYWHMGADGIYFFNLFCRGFPLAEDSYAILRECSAGPEALVGRGKLYCATHESWRPDTDVLFARMRGPDRPARVGIYVGDDLAAAHAAGTLRQATLRLRIDHAMPSDPIEVALNGARVDLLAARREAGDPKAEAVGWCWDRPYGLLGNPWFWLEVDLDVLPGGPVLPRQGDNVVTVRSFATGNRRLTDVDIAVRYEPHGR